MGDRARRGVLLAAAVVVVGVVVTSIVASASGDIDNAATRLPDALVVAPAPPASVIGVLRDIRTRREVRPQTVFGVLCVCILLGTFFANVLIVTNLGRRRTAVQ